MILYVSESWVVMGAMLKVLEGFYHQPYRQIMGSLEAAVLHPILEYIRRRQATRVPIYELYVDA